MIAWFRGASLLIQIASVAGALLLLWGGVKAWEYKNYREGVQAEREATENANKERLGNAEEFSRNRKACVDAFGVDAWDVTRGVCNHQ
jgi:threonine/homoserine/homoserine lactone efflux protein